MMKPRTREIEILPEAWELARRLYDVMISYDDENGYIARVAEMPDLLVAEETMDELRPSLEKMMALHITADLLSGRPVPQPRALAAR